MNAPMEATRFGSGKSVRRIEDPALVTGQGRYTDDETLPGQTHLVFLRSPYAHADINGIDASAARAMPTPAPTWSPLVSNPWPVCHFRGPTANPAPPRRAAHWPMAGCALSARRW